MVKFREHVEIRDIPPWSGSYCYNLSPKRVYLDQILLKCALQTSTVEFWHGYKVEELLYEGNRVSGIVAAQSGRTRYAQAALIVAADGRDSFVVKAVKPAKKKFYSAYRAWFVAYLSGWQGDRTEVLTGTQGTDWIGVTATHDGQMLASLSVPLSMLPDFKHRPRDEFRLFGISRGSH